ncbi:MAG TPA: RimK/LysX family protein [Bacteroidia bacterium]|nr:RimK/LysX family protein [Bacteroidia bacterium]
MSKEIIGKTALVDLPRLGFLGISAKIDTGAYYCSLHCHHIEVRNIEGIDKLCFMLLDPGHPEYKDKEIKFKHYTKKTIRNSFGDTEERYSIRTALRIHGRRIKTWVTLTDRGSMTYPMLIGRRLLKNKFLVDVAWNEIKNPKVS